MEAEGMLLFEYKSYGYRLVHFKDVAHLKNKAI